MILGKDLVEAKVMKVLPAEKEESRQDRSGHKVLEEVKSELNDIEKKLDAYAQGGREGKQD
jgi:hypothetical protein